MSDNTNNTDKKDKSNISEKDKKESSDLTNEKMGNQSFPMDLTLSDTLASSSVTTLHAPINPAIPEDSFSTLYDEFQNTIIECGFEDKIRFSNDFQPKDIKIRKEDKKYVVYGRMQQPTQDKSTTISYHSFEYVREFNRPIKNVEIEVGRGIASVYGEFGDI
uniref:Spore wall protein 8 n=2 Tax=Nosema TaxID=27977 RepID=G3CU65_9MICR|nr:spore wall protein 8 [Nosema antheraeae]